VLLCASSSTTKVVVDPRLTALYKDSTTLVGIDNQKEELVRWVEGEEKQLKVMSIVGFGGLGKTTLANEVYHKVRGHFNRNAAFVPVSQKPDVPRLLSKVCSKLGLSPSSHACDVQELIDTLRQHLNDKRYSFVLILITLPYLTYKVSYVLTLIFDHILIQYNIYIDVLLSLHCRIIFYPNS
jgi:Cdc6-like AAA superfamily ATPase